MPSRFALLLIASLAIVPPALACAPAPPELQRIDVVEESAVIVWDPAAKTEHFIRRATFEGKAKDFGFLVPTPTAPKLAAVDDAIFDTLTTMTARKSVHTVRKRIDWTPLVFMPFLVLRNKGETMTGAAPVEVLSTQKVAGYDAAILDATDTKALTEWLSTNGYATTPDLAAWLDAYVKQRWIISAFKIDKSQSDIAAQTSAVKMSFTTDRPFFPYREPASQRESQVLSPPRRSLRVWFLGPERVAGSVGERPWQGELLWSDQLDAKSRTDLTVATSVPIPPNARLTFFHDTATPRPGIDDLFFARSADQRPHVPPPWVIETVERTHVPLDVVALGLFVVVFGIRQLRS